MYNMSRKIRSYTFLVAVSLLFLITIGCLGGGGPKATYTLTVLVEDGGNNPLSGVQLKVNDTFGETDSTGTEVFTGVSGNVEILATLAGFTTYNEKIHVTKSTTVEVTLFPVVASTPEKYFSFDSTTGTITGYDESGGLDVVIPSTIDGMAVKHIGDYAFASGNPDREQMILSVILPDGLLSVGRNAFYENEIATIVIPDSVIELGYRSFRRNKIDNLTLSTNLVSIGAQSFRNNELTELVIPEGIVHIEETAFRENKLVSVSLPSTLETIGEQAFQSNLLGSITFPNGLTQIGDSAFRNNVLVTIVIPDGVTEIGRSAFSGNEITEMPLLPITITSIPRTLFSENNITSIAMPNHITEIGAYAFYNNEIASISAADLNNVTFIDGNAFSNNRIESLELSTTIQTLGSASFDSNQLTSLEIPGNVAYVGSLAFSRNQLQYVGIPDDIEVGMAAFRQNELTLITIGSNVTLGDHLLAGGYGDPVNDNFRIAYNWYGAGTYAGTQTGSWTKLDLPNIEPKTGSFDVTDSPGTTVVSVTRLISQDGADVLADFVADDIGASYAVALERDAAPYTQLTLTKSGADINVVDPSEADGSLSGAYTLTITGGVNIWTVAVTAID